MTILIIFRSTFLTFAIRPLKTDYPPKDILGLYAPLVINTPNLKAAVLCPQSLSTEMLVTVEVLLIKT